MASESAADTSVFASDSPPVVLQTVSRALKVLGLFVEDPQLGVREVARILNINPGAAHRVLVTLAEHEYLERVRDERTFRLGRAVGRLSEAYHAQNDFADIALGLMHSLRADINETVGLHEVRGGVRTCVLSVESTHDLRMVVPVGLSAPVTVGATDLVFRAFSRPDVLLQIEQAKSAALASGDPRADAPAIAPGALEEVRGRGWAITYGTRTKGAVAISAPLRLGDDVLSLSVLGPAFRMEEKNLDGLGARVAAIANEMSAALAVVGRSRQRG